MKKLIFTALSITLLAGGMTACAKSTKGKMSNDWKIESYEENSTSTESNGTKTVTSEVYNGSTIVTTTITTPNGMQPSTTTSTQTMATPTFKIEKDGTWSMSKTIVSTNSQAGMTTTITEVRAQSGTWNFIGKNKNEDFKKNERVLFNVLNESTNSTNVVTMAGGAPTTATGNSSYTYKAGEYVLIYTVTESKGKSLELSTETANSNVYGNNSSNHTGSTSMKLVQ